MDLLMTNISDFNLMNTHTKSITKSRKSTDKKFSTGGFQCDFLLKYHVTVNES